RCRPYGACVLWIAPFYTDAAPMGLMMECYTRSTQIPPLQGLVPLVLTLLHRYRPYGAMF
ncbi:MAG: hypothetical protein OXH39_04125, partial [Candidatus Poribacteria bacterium]|nr:hypothetical protein [Candidatus Poribacteria bacterium]